VLIAGLSVGLSFRLSAEEVDLDPALQTGLTAGERADQFLVKDCTGPAAGKTLCYYCRYGLRPVVCIFSRDASEQLSPLLAGVDKLVRDRRDQSAAGFVVYLGKDTANAEKSLKRMAQQQRIRRLPFTIYKDQPDKLRDIFQLSPEAEVTVLIWREGIVQDTLAFSTPTQKELPALLTRIDRALHVENE